MQFEAHNATTQRPKRDPGFGPRPYVERTEAHEIAPGMGAEFSDRAERAAGRKLKSAYAHLVALPRVVSAGDTATAAAILNRIDQCIDKGGWTKNEWARLHKLRDAWAARAHRQDVSFNLRGWRQQGTGHHTPSVEQALAAIKREIRHQCGPTSSQRAY